MLAEVPLHLPPIELVPLLLLRKSLLFVLLALLLPQVILRPEVALPAGVSPRLFLVAG